MNASLSVTRVHSALEGTLLWAKAIAHELGDDFPDYCAPHDGTWARNGGWTEGFWPGILWQLYRYQRDPQVLDLARRYTRLLAARKRDLSDHDLGFLYDHSCVLEHALTGDESMAQEALAAAERLAARYNPAGRFIRAHGDLSDPERAGYAIIDTIMNLHLLFWAHEHARQEKFHQIAVHTAATIAREYIRSDDSTCQVVWFSPTRGAVERKATLQGYDAGSCWSRGQAWGIYGFVRVYIATGEERYRGLAISLARYFLEHLPASGMVPYDFLDPAVPDVPTDTSAQAIAAAGLLLLAGISTGAGRRVLRDGAVRLLAPLLDTLPAPAASGRSHGLLPGGCYFLKEGRGVGSELIFGNYYLVEALMRYLDLQAWA